MTSGRRRYGLTPTQQLYLLPGVFLAAALLYLATRPALTSLDIWLSLGPTMLVVVVTIAILRLDLPPDRYPRVLGWAVLGAAALGGLTLLLILIPQIPIDRATVSLLLALEVGAVAGSLSGANEARAIERGREVERERQKVKLAEQEQARLEHLAHLLRHDVLNKVNVIEGNVALLQTEPAFEDNPRLDVIDRQTRAITDLITNVRAYLETIAENETVTDQDLSETLQREIDGLRSAFPDATIDTDVPDGLTVTADDLLHSVFSNLLRNAIVHNPSDNPHVAVSVERTDDAAVVRIVDDGPGIPEAVQESLFERSDHGDHGFGLYLVDTLVDRYNGSVSVESTGPNGTTVAVALPRATTAKEPTAAAPPNASAID